MASEHSPIGQAPFPFAKPRLPSIALCRIARQRLQFSTQMSTLQIEILNPEIPRGQIRAALLDFDGTLSLIRRGWQEVMIRFEYVTDAAVHGEGMLLDDIAVPEIGYFTDFEEDDGGWEGAGWVRVANVLPQTFRLALIEYGSSTTVEYITLDENNQVEVQFEIGGDVDEVVLVVMGTTRFTRQLAAYQFKFIP